MKTINYKCDCQECGNVTNDIQIDEWIEIGSQDGSFFINSYLKNRRLISLGKYRDIHFCSSKCLTQYFFEDSDKQ